MNMHLRQVIALQIQTFREGLQSHQHAALAVIDALAMGFHQPVTGLVALDQQKQAQVGHMFQKTLHRPSAGKQHQHTGVLSALNLFAEVGRHFSNVLLFVVDQRLILHARDHQLPLLAVVKRRIQRDKTIARFLFQAAHLLQPREAVQGAQRGGGHDHVRHAAPDELFQLIGHADAHAVEKQVDLAVAHFTRGPFGDRRARRLRHRGQPPELALGFEHAERTVHLQQNAVQANNVMGAGFLAEIV